MAGVSKTIDAVDTATAFRVLYWWRQHCKQISNGCLEIFKKIITLLTVTVLFLFTFFNLILDAPRTILRINFGITVAFVCWSIERAICCFHTVFVFAQCIFFRSRKLFVLSTCMLVYVLCAHIAQGTSAETSPPPFNFTADYDHKTPTLLIILVSFKDDLPLHWSVNSSMPVLFDKEDDSLCNV